MSLQRSKSAPQSLTELSTAAVIPRTLSFQTKQNEQNFINGTDKGDPFNLSGFFPALRGSKAWSWLRNEDTVPPRDDDEEEEAIIKGEDKMGVLSLGKLMRGFTLRGPLTEKIDAGQLLVGKTEMGEEERLLSPYCSEEAVDHESLYLGLCSRRLANTWRG